MSRPPTIPDADPPTDEDVNNLICRAATLLDELRDTFTHIKDLMAHVDGEAP